jgi:hypothetical protein
MCMYNGKQVCGAGFRPLGWLEGIMGRVCGPMSMREIRTQALQEAKVTAGVAMLCLKSSLCMVIILDIMELGDRLDAKAWKSELRVHCVTMTNAAQRGIDCRVSLKDIVHVYILCCRNRALSRNVGIP